MIPPASCSVTSDWRIASRRDVLPWSTSVSYTHLDVYKRQDANIVKDKEEEVSTDELKKAIEAAEALIESDYTARCV